MRWHSNSIKKLQIWKAWLRSFTSELEPTRSVLIRSAAFLNLKAGLVANAQRFIFFGLLNSKDELIKSQLNNALELSVSLTNLSPQEATKEFNYLNLLR